MIKVYDQDVNMLATLDYADAVGYRLPHNDLWTATFKLPAHDPKNAYCQMHNLVSIEDGPRDIGLYRIIGAPDDDITGLTGYTVYSCEHVAATLLDDILFGYHEIGGGTVRTADVIRYILAQQETPRWQLGVCEFSNRFVYKFENDTLLSALLSLGNVLAEPYTWDFDTSTTPWTVNLRKADSEAGCGIYYARNLQQITRSVDAANLVTRLYLLGYGEGVNQLTISDINGGRPYLDADTISVYGIKKSVFCDRRFENAESLKARGETLLESLKIPYMTYTASAVDLVQLTGDDWDKFMPGKVAHVMDGEDGIEFEARLVLIEKDDINGRCGDVRLTIANSVRDISDSINALADRQGINELYSQGATNLYAQQYADNADKAHPARMRVYIPNGCVRINQMLLSFDVEAFRAYETGAASGGGTTVTSEDGGGTTVTSSSGGGTTVTSSSGGGSERTSSAGGSTTVTTEQKVISNALAVGGALYNGSLRTSTGSSSPSTVSSGSHTHSFSDSDSFGWGHTHGLVDGASNTSGVNNYAAKTVNISGDTSTAGSHTHTVNSHSHSMDHYHTGAAEITIPAMSVTIPSHRHTVSIDDHDHDVSIDDHDHDVTIDPHSHDVTIDPHTHDIVHGIYEGGTASKISIVVDGTPVPGHTAASADELDIVAYLSKDSEGKILRGVWHTVELVPDTLTRIEANLFVQAFIQSVGGGNY